MAEPKNYLLGYGERLTAAPDPPKRRPEKSDTYTFAESKVRLTPRIREVAAEIMELPAAACPQRVDCSRHHPSVVSGEKLFPKRIV